MHVQSDNLLLVEVVENFRNMCLEIYKVDPVKFLSAPGLAWQESLKKLKVKLDFLTGIDVFNGRKRYKRRNISLYLLLYKS